MESPLSHAVEHVRLTRRQAIYAGLIGVLTVALLGLIFSARLMLVPLTPAEASFVEGQASPVTVLAPDRITYVSQLDTRQAQERAAAEVAEVYGPPDAEIARRQVRSASQILDFLDTLRSDPYSTRSDKIEWMTSVPTVTVSVDVISRTLELDPTAYRQVISETLYVLDQAMREEIRPDQLPTASSKLSTRVSLVLSADQADLVTQWAKSFLIANTFYDPTATNLARQHARDSVGVVYRTIQKGEAVVRAGELITPGVYEALTELGYTQPQDTSPANAAGALYALFLVIVGGLYLARFAPLQFAHPRVLLLLSLLLVGTAFGAKLVIPGRSLLPFVFPFAVAAMLGASLLEAEVGIGMALLSALAVGFVARGDVELTTFALAGGIIAVITLRHRDRLTAFLATGLFIALANALVILIFRLGSRDPDWVEVAQLMAAGGASGALVGLIGLGSQFVLGRLAGLTTALELIELSRPTHPLLQKLLREAPGTYHHSLIISNLAEQAAQRIGADALLLRVAAYYHDVGKTLNPQYYVENQFDGVNIHDGLEPRASAIILQQHVSDGLELTRRYGISNRVREFIPQHHGTTLATFFYDRALKQANGKPVDQNDFRYPGPRPQTREAVIMMLADGVEATSRADRPTTPEQIRAIIERIVDQRVREGQLDEAPISFRDLDLIKQAFFDVLQGLYHPRIRYPQPPHLAPRSDEPVQAQPDAR